MIEDLENAKDTAPTDAKKGPASPSAPDGETSAAPAKQPEQKPAHKGRHTVPIRIQDDEDDEGSFIQRNKVILIIAGVLIVGVGWAIFGKGGGKAEAPQKKSEPPMIKIQLPPPPPPPPPPKLQPPPPQKEQKQNNEQAPMAKPDKPAEAKPKPVDKPPEGLGTNIKGPGAGMAGLGSSGNGMIGGTGSGPGGGGSMGAWYASQVQGKVAEALRTNPKTRSASVGALKFSVTVDATGRVTSVKLLSSTGDSKLDDAIRNDVLNGLRISEPPPGGKPMTVTLALNARRPK